MPNITDVPPDEIQDEIKELRVNLERLPSKAIDSNLLIATWNIRAFGNLTEKWEADDSDSPKRDLHSLLCIAEIISKFDIIAIQEVKSNIKAFRHMLKVLGPNWQFLMTDETRGDAGNNERLAFLFDTRKVRLSGLACEIVIPIDENSQTHPLQTQFARTPYAVGFQAGGRTLVLVTLHVLYGKNAAAREPELKEIALWMKDWALDMNVWDHNLIVLGDFNIDRKEDILWQAFTSTGLAPAEHLKDTPRSIFSKEGSADTEKYYDQIAWFHDDNGIPALSLKPISGGYYDFVGQVLVGRGYSKTKLSWRISDHYPLYVEFDTRILPD